ncbi:hypothetical protein SFRURICE_009313 [Spodoptera frugiperda]|nr:hypothetical protein SFRURICE_009313 [Spodoptera frugiperda]
MIKIMEKLKILPKPTFQVLLNNKLEKEIQRVVHSFNFPLKIFCASKYNICHDRLYPRGHKYQCLAFCFTMFMNLVCTYRMFTVDITDQNMSESENDMVILLSALYYLLYIIGFTVMFILDILHKQDNVFIIIEIQAIHRSLDFSKNIWNYIIWNWVSIFAIIFINFYMYASFVILYENSTSLEILTDYFCDIVFTTFEVNYVISIRIMMLLKQYLDEWTRGVLMENQQVNEDRNLRLFGSYGHILKAYELYQKTFEVLTLCHVVNTFIRSLLALYIILFSTKRYTSSSGGATPFYIIGSFVWVSKNAILVTIHAVCCERFYIAIEEATSACIQLLKNGDYNTWLYKRVKQMNRTFSKMSACGLFYVDATLILCLMGVITNYAVICVVLLMNFCCVYSMFSVEVRRPNVDDIAQDMSDFATCIMLIFGIFYYFLHVISFNVLFIVDFFYKQRSVCLILEIQTIYRRIGLCNSIQTYIIGNWVSQIINIVIEIMLLVIYYFFFSYGNFTTLLFSGLSDYIFIMYYIYYVSGIRIIVLLKECLDKWMQKVLLSQMKQENEEYYLNLFKSYQNIINAYSIYKEIYRILVVKNVFRIVIHTAYCEMFYITVEEAEAACIQLLKNRQYTKGQERLYKRVKQMNRTFSKMSACGLFYVDATLILCLMGVITNYAVVMLQFIYF